MKKITITFALILAAFVYSNAQTCIPDTLCITGVARYPNNTPVADTTIDVQIETSEGFPLGNGSNIKYCELLLNITTNSFGEFTACFGAPVFLCTPFDPFSQMPWDVCDLHYRLGWRITGQATITSIVTSKFGTVPFAFAARTAESLVTSNGATDGQALTWNVAQQKWLATTLSTTGSVSLQQGAGISITGTNPYTITNTGDGDNSASNELQTLSLSGNTLSLSNGGGQVTLPGGGTTYTAGAGISISGTTISATDASATNEIQTLSLAGQTLSLSNGGGSVTVPSSSTLVTIVREQQNSGINSLNATMTNTAWNQRAFTDVVGSTTNVTLNSPGTTATITLQPGTYYIRALALIIGQATSNSWIVSKLRFISLTNSSNFIVGQRQYFSASDPSFAIQFVSPLDGIITVSGGQESFKLEQWVSLGGNGIFSNGGVQSASSSPEIYAEVVIMKVQ